MAGRPQRVNILLKEQENRRPRDIGHCLVPICHFPDEKTEAQKEEIIPQETHRKSRKIPEI